MDNQIRSWLDGAIEYATVLLETLHRMAGRADAEHDYRPPLRFVEDDPKVLPFPGAEKGKKILTLEDINKMLLELNVKLKARQRADGLFEIRPTIGGRRISIYGRTADEIAQKLKKYLKNSKQFIPAKGKLLLFDWFEEWLEVYKKPNVAKNTYENLERCIRVHLKPNLKNKGLNQYSMTELAQALNQIESTRMRQYARGTLRDALNCAVTVGHIKNSPAQNLPPVKHVVQKGKAIPLLDLLEMIQRAKDVLQRDVLRAYLFCLFAGTRRDETSEMRAGDLDFKNKIVYIRGTKTEGSNRRIPMFKILEKIVAEKYATSTSRIFNIAKHRLNHDFKIFTGENSDATLHWLRHTFGTIQICVLGIPANTVALWLGHADVSTTMQIYTHPEDLAPDIYFSGVYSEIEKHEILMERYNKIISTVEEIL